MPVLVRIALRNLGEHKAKSFIIGIIVAMGVTILVVGNSFINTAALGIKRSFTNNFTGDVFISPKSDSPISVVGVGSVGGTEATPLLADYEKVFAYVRGNPATARVTPQISAFASLNVEGNENSEDAIVTVMFGIEPATYHQMFDNLTMVSGTYLAPDQEGILLSQNEIAKIKENLKTDVAVGDQVVLSSFGSTGFHIREVTVRGIFAFKQVDPMETTSNGGIHIAYVDAQTLRALQGMTVGTSKVTNVDKNATALLGSSDSTDSSLFGGGSMVAVDSGATKAASATSLDNILGDMTQARQAEQLDTGAWNFLLVDLRNPGDVAQYIADTNAWFASQKIAAVAGDWKKGAGAFGSLADGIRGAFVIAILVVAIVAVIIIMNTLMISVIERTSEIGTMRALGAQKAFVWRMFIIETLTISIVFGAAGMVLGLGVIGVVNAIGIPITSPFLQVLLAGTVLRPVVSWTSLLTSFVVVVVIGVLAHIYPVSIALRVEPVRAIQTD